MDFSLLFLLLLLFFKYSFSLSVHFILQVVNTPCWSWKFYCLPYCATIKSTRIWRKRISNYKRTLYWSVRKDSKYELSDENPRRQRLKHANRSYFHWINKHHNSNDRKQIQQIFFSTFKFSVLWAFSLRSTNFFFFFWPKKNTLLFHFFNGF